MVMSLCPRFLAHPVYTFTKFLPNAPRGGQLTATVADRSHATAGSRIWNGLPDDRLHVCRIFTNISAKTESTFISIILPGHYSVTVSVISLCVLTHGRHLRSSASAALVVPPVRRRRSATGLSVSPLHWRATVCRRPSQLHRYFPLSDDSSRYFCSDLY